MMRDPTSHEIAIAIVTASRRQGIDPIAVAEGQIDPPGDGKKKVFPISRARIYAAFALAEVFDEISEGRIARWCGAAKYGCASFFSNKRGTKWLDQAEVTIVVAAIVRGSVPPWIQDGEKGDPVGTERGTAKTHDVPPSPPVMTHSSAPAKPKTLPPEKPAKPVARASTGRVFVSDPDFRPPPPPTGPGKRSLESMLRDAVVNTGGKLVDK